MSPGKFALEPGSKVIHKITEKIGFIQQWVSGTFHEDYKYLVNVIDKVCNNRIQNHIEFWNYKDFNVVKRVKAKRPNTQHSLF